MDENQKINDEKLLESQEVQAKQKNEKIPKKGSKVFISYILILALVVVVVISVLTALGGQINTSVNTINNVLSNVNCGISTSSGPTFTNLSDNYSIVPPPNIPMVNTEKYENFDENSVKLASKEPVSTFSLDVDTASYSNLRRFISQDQLPPKDAIRLEELINYFNYDYELPSDRSKPFKPSVHMFPTPWNKDTKILHIGIKGFDINPESRPKINLTFLVDTSGSMENPDKLPLLVKSLKVLINELDKDDTISLVTYAGSSGVVLNPTKVKNKSRIIDALDRLYSSGSTAGCDGIKTAYQLAQENFDKEGVNRVILATDGDFNVGTVDIEQLKDLIERKRETGIYLSVLGFGMDNYNDHLMQTLAQNGNGIAAYIDNIDEANKIFSENMYKNMFPIANDVKVQVEFNPAKVAEYRLIGYETRILNKEDFKNDKVDAGDIGAGHSVTAIYEITEPGSKARLLSDNRYIQQKPIADNNSDEYAFVKIRYKLPKQTTSRLIEYPITEQDQQNDIKECNKDIIFATTVAGFGQIIKQSKFSKDFTYDDVISLANYSKGEDRYNYRGEFVKLVRKAKNLDKNNIEI